jgi:hypothetical protein
VLTPPGAPAIARHRTRPILTPLPVRLAILEEVAGKPEETRLRAIRRRLTALDRALSDSEAELLERIISCVNALSNVGCVDYLNAGVKSSPYGRLPFGEARRREIAAMTFVIRKLSVRNRASLLGLAARLDPSATIPHGCVDEAFLAAIREAAQAVVALYAEWHKQVRR